MIQYINTVTSKEEMLEKINNMNSVGIRLTGSKAHNDFIKQIKDEIHTIGLETYSDPYYFNHWEETSSSITLHKLGENEKIHVSSAFPYSGETDENGITTQLTFVSDQRLGFIGTSGKIAVVKINELNSLPSTIAFNIRNKFPKSASIPEKYNGPVATAFVNFPLLQLAKVAGCLGVICVWEGMPDEMIEGQYLPFILDYQGIPALWVNSTDGEKILDAAKNGESATLLLTAEKEDNARTESFYTIIEGKNKSEAIIINSHTDGTNCIEENGPIAMLSMIKYFSENAPERTLIFVFVTGHFRLPDFKSSATGGVQATSKWLAEHTDLWDGKKGHIKAVAGVSVEHLGSVMWKSVNGEYKKTGDIETELVYTGNNIVDKVYYKALEGREKVNTITLRGHNFLHFGEGQPLFNCGIPEIALVTAPDCLTVVSETNEMDKFDINLMYEQTETFIKIVRILLSMPSKEISSCDKYSIVFPEKEPFVYKKIKAILKK